jgi:hypothetical protein
MKKIDLNKKRFTLLANSKNGKVSNETLFYYQEKEGLVTAKYVGGTIRYGRIIATRDKDNNLQMLYQCLTVDGELKAGSAEATISINGSGRIQLDLRWHWLNGDQTSGTSTYVEID